MKKWRMINIFCNVFVSFTRVCILGCIILLKYLRRACKVPQGASTLFKVCLVMQEPFEASLSTLGFHAMSGFETANVPQASLETNNTGDSAQPSALSSDTSLSNAETLQLFFQLLDVKFDQ